MGKIYFGTPDGKELRPLETIETIELTPEDSGIDDKMRFLEGKSESFECELTLKIKDGLDPYRFLASGGNRGLYNGLALKEDGRLSPENAWIGEEDE